MDHSTDSRASKLEGAITQLARAYTQRNPQSKAQHEKALAVMPGGNTRSVLFYDPFPLAMVRGEGCTLWDADGHSYLDMLAEFTAGLYGHSNGVIRNAIDAALNGGINLSAHNVLESQLAELICQRFTSMVGVRFTNSGTEANLMAIAAAVAFTKRRKIVVFEGGYHGGVLTFLSGASPVNVPHEFIYAKYNDPDGLRALLKEHRDVAAVIVEPMQGAGGCIPADTDFLKAIREETNSVGALLIFDEVMTSRLGPGGRQAQIDITADLTTLGKYIGGGMSFGAFGGRADVMAQFDPRRPDALSHAGTFNNNVLSMAAGIAGLSEVYTPEVATALNVRGEVLRQRLNARCAADGLALQFTGLGSLMNLHGTAAPIRSVADVKKAESSVRDLFFFHMAAYGIYVARRGFVVLSLPLTDDHLKQFANAFDEFVTQFRDLLRG